MDAACTISVRSSQLQSSLPKEGAIEVGRGVMACPQAAHERVKQDAWKVHCRGGSGDVVACIWATSPPLQPTTELLDASSVSSTHHCQLRFNLYRKHLLYSTLTSASNSCDHQASRQAGPILLVTSQDWHAFAASVQLSQANHFVAPLKLRSSTSLPPSQPSDHITCTNAPSIPDQVCRVPCKRRKGPVVDDFVPG